MKKIKLTQNKIAIIDEVDFEMVSRYKWCASKHGEKYYAQTTTKDAKSLLMHMLILGKRPGYEIDHGNNNGLDNRRINLRHATRSQNNMNKRKSHGTSIYKGVSWKTDKSKWKAQIRKNKIDHHLGYYATQKEAAKAYNSAAIIHFGEFARLNQF